MAEKKAILLMLPSVALSGASEALDKLKKKAVLLANADSAGLEALALELGGKKVEAAALEAADRRTLVVVAAADGVAFYGLAVDSKAGAVARAVDAQDIAVTIATIVDLPVSAQCTGGIIYQAMKNPNLKLDEIRKLKEALVRMESVIQRDNREPWDKHDCA